MLTLHSVVTSINSMCPPHLFSITLLRIVLISANPVNIRRPVHAAAEFARIRHSLNLLEQQLSRIIQIRVGFLPFYPPEPIHRGSLPPNQPSPYDTNAASTLSPEPESYSHDKEKTEDLNMTSTPGMLDQRASGGQYSGPASSKLYSCITLLDSDVDFNLLPDIHMIDGLIEYYFEYCNWVHRHVNETMLLADRDRYKRGKHGDCPSDGGDRIPEDPEETWNTVADRRRWARWHVTLLERWQAFMFGTPLAITSQHFNTHLPTYCDRALDKSPRLFLPNIALFKLAYERDKMLTEWYEALPSELDLDDYRIARSLPSPITPLLRLGVQGVIIRAAYHHIPFTLHRPYVKPITLVGQTRPDFLSKTALVVPDYMNWGPFHVFSAAMFFSFQFITKPDQPAASLFRENIRKSIASLEQSRWMPVAHKALTILQALDPLYSDESLEDLRKEAERKKA
ncbi:hypothetical protein LXA43DRAFT_1142386 [Ganoderma leucocontextum]|nr:hypothetical protein LXA43DRAFT_1142386 [Ganoderma leucocontextum]